MATTTVVSRRASWLPYGAIVATFTLLVVADRGDSALPLTITVIAVAVAVVVGARQLLAQRALADEQARNRVLVVQLRHQAFHDVLTGIANRAQLNVELDRLITPWSGSGRNQAILMIDLDDFKGINDSFGHGVGDQVLIAVAERVQTLLRHGDTAARLGGDEFVVLADNLAGATEAVAIGERILDALSTPLELAVGTLVPRASMGIAVSSVSSVSAELLLREADSALYQAKRTGRRLVLSDPQCVFQ